MITTQPLEISNPKGTTQSALLEAPLTWMRTRKVKSFIRGKRVLDFGCGEHLTTLRSFRNKTHSAAGFDILFQDLPPQTSIDGIKIFGNLDHIDGKFDVVTALACFEHIEPEVLPSILKKIKAILARDGVIIGTVPRPPAKPVLEFLSYRLGLIDPSQILDHKIYYDKTKLSEVAALGGFELHHYSCFQMGMNSFFIMKPTST